jgi:glutamate dehydrogenase
VRINSDALDNSAGVSTSDHEVNIKILLADAEAEGRMTRQQRDTLLRDMTDEVAALVLADNHAQSLAVSLETMRATEDIAAHGAMMQRLEAEGLLDRAVAGLPDEAALRARAMNGEGLTRPEIAALLPFAKLWLNDAIENSDLPDEPALAPLLVGYFPTALREQFAALIPRHRLRRELIATVLSNAVANRLGVAGIARLGGDGAAIARAAWLADALYGLEAAAAAVDASAAPAAQKLAVLLGLRQLQEGAARGLMQAGSLAATRDALAPGVAAIVGIAEAAPSGAVAVLTAAGVPPRAAALAATPGLAEAPSIVQLAQAAGVTPEAADSAWDGVGEQFALEALRAAAERARVTGPFAARAKAETLADLAALQARLARAHLGGAMPAEDVAAEAARLAREAAAAGDLVAIGVAARALGALV